MISLTLLISRTLTSVNLRSGLCRIGIRLIEESVIRKLMASTKCGVCGQRYEVDNIHVLGHEKDLWFLKVYCSACHSQALVAAVIKEGKIPDFITDLTEVELDKFKNADVITADDVLDAHIFLRDVDGDFSQLFSQK